jgi:cytochrome d ubiquinol oxidase subunit I
MFPTEMDRTAIAYSLGIHILFVSISLALPIIMVVAEYIGFKRNNAYFDLLSRRMSKAMVLFFAIGTASGIAVAVELLVLWPGFMGLVASVAILPFYVEVFAFFMEGIALGIYIYSWDKIANRYLHMFFGAMIAFFANLSGVLIIMVNAWMNTPNGFNISAYLENGALTGLNPLSVFGTPSTLIEVMHGLGSTLFTGAFLILTYFAIKFLRAKSTELKYYFKSGLKIALGLVSITFIPVGLGGTLSMGMLGTLEPAKYAALDMNLVPHSNAYEYLFGWKVPIPGLQSILLTGKSLGIVPGLSSFPKSDWPPLFVHTTFDLMTIFGIILGVFIIVSLIAIATRYYISKSRNLKRKPRLSRIFDPVTGSFMTYATVFMGAIAMITLELGWITDEVGRQPWIVYDVVKTYTVSNLSGWVIPLGIFIMVVYSFLAVFTVFMFKRILTDDDILLKLKDYQSRERKISAGEQLATMAEGSK